MVVMRLHLFVAFALTGCAVASGSRISAPITSAESAASRGLSRTGGPAAGDHASVSGPSVVGAASFPRSFLIPRIETSIRIGR
jgi:hypothetical protein